MMRDTNTMAARPLASHAQPGGTIEEVDRQAVEKRYGLNAAVGCAFKEPFGVAMALQSGSGDDTVGDTQN